MLLLPPENKILADTVSAQFKPLPLDEDDKPIERMPIDVKLCDFDDVQYRVSIDVNDRDNMIVSIYMPCYEQIKDHGAKASLTQVYGSLLLSEPESNFHVSLKINLNNLPCPHEELTQKLASLKFHILAGVFDYYFSALMANKPVSNNFSFSLRADTQIYFVPRADKVTVIYGVDFNEKTDQLIAKVFLQEFVEIRRRFGAAPPVSFSQNPPLEMKEFGISEATGNLGFVSFAVMKAHLEGGRKDKVIAVLQSFRNYLQYHIKSSKGYFHSRMRARVVSLLKVLNRAKIEIPADKKELKNASGKTFIKPPV